MKTAPCYVGVRVLALKTSWLFKFMNGRIAPVEAPPDVHPAGGWAANWGVHSNGSLAASYAILADCCGHKMAQMLARDFWTDVVAELPYDGFLLALDEVRAYVVQWVARNVDAETLVPKNATAIDRKELGG